MVGALPEGEINRLRIDDRCPEDALSATWNELLNNDGEFNINPVNPLTDELYSDQLAIAKREGVLEIVEQIIRDNLK